MKRKLRPQRRAVVSAVRFTLLAAVLLVNLGRAFAQLVPGEIIDFGANLLPVPDPSTHFRAVAAADVDNLALKDNGTLVAWASPNTQDADTLTNIAQTLSNVKAIAAIQNINMVLFTNGTVAAWGGDNEGMTNVPDGLSNVVAIALGAYNSLALQSNGNIVSWGYGYEDDDGNPSPPPVNGSIVAIAAGLTHALAMTQGGTVLTWGSFAYVPDATNKPVNASYLMNAKAIAAGDYHDLVLKNDGTVVGWGGDDYGECDPPPSATNVVAISAGDSFSVALRADGTVVAWGDGLDRETNTAGLSNVVTISAEYEHTLALIGPLSGSTPPAQPSLSKKVSGHNFILSWPSSFTGFSLQTNANLAKTNLWSSVTTTPVIVNSQYTVTNPLTSSLLYYRLFK